ncbi:hypothetical protein CDV31_015616 [Fusarium ambrosium]|uniref:Aldehyde dehydrogenase domain-containing protein n=1 Tax=Fusarium ambrosium TaxID=131363 RepID=A0A428SLT5_9HYPO|nr:hypothetical protein CDV31_015616 [Fusarium ambrosium]
MVPSDLATVDRCAFLYKIAELVDRDRKLLASIDALDNGKTYPAALEGDLDESYSVFRACLHASRTSGILHLNLKNLRPRKYLRRLP